MRTRLIVIHGIGGKNSPQVCLTEDDHMVQALASQRADQTFSDPILPWRLPDDLTAAHKKLPFGTRVKVTNPLTGASAIVIINDRGPFTRGRDIDLSQGAARAIGPKSVGTVCTEIL